MSDPSTAAGNSASQGLHPASTLVAWLEAHVRGRRVAVLGDATAGLAEALVGRGARLVHAYDPDPARAAEAAAVGGRSARPAGAGPRPVFAPLEGDLGVRDGAFDVVVTPDLGLFGDSAEALRRVRRLLSPSGIAVIASRNPDATRWLVRAGAATPSSPSYYDLYDLVSLQFPEVKMLGQTPFVGYAIVDFAADEPEVTVDASLLEEPEAPEWYVAVAGDRRLDLDAYALVELPFADVAQAFAGEPTTLRRLELMGRQELLHRQEAGRQELVDEHAAAQKALEGRMRELEGESARLREALESASGAARDRELIASRLADAERELAAAVARMREAEARAADTHVRAERLSTELRELDDELRRQRERATRLNKLLDEEKRGRGRVPQAPSVAFAPPPAPDSAALTMRPAGLPADDARRAAAREATLRHELDRATARIVELERRVELEKRAEHAAPPSTVEPVTAEPATLDRERARQRDRESSGLAEAEQRIHQLEGRLAERETKLAERDAQIAKRDILLAERDAKLAEREARLADRDGREAEAERRLVAALAQRETIEARLAAAEPELVSLRALHEKLDARRAAAERSLADVRGSLERAEAKHARAITELRGELDAATARAEAAERRAASSADAGALQRAHEEEIDRLESALRDRGREIARLQADLREGLRVGKELLQDLEAARIIPPVTPGGRSSAGGGGDGSFVPAGAPRAADVGARIEAAAEHAARAEADLVGASLKIAQLEHEVRRLRTTRTADDARRELESALVLAQQEIAGLRAERVTPGADAQVPAGAAIEQQVLLHQIEAMPMPVDRAREVAPPSAPPSGG